MRIVTTRPAARCAVCHDVLDGLAVVCAGCDSVGHVECWAELGRCSTLGCARSGPARRPVAVVAVERAKPSRDWIFDTYLLQALVLVAIVGLVGAVVTVNVMGQGTNSRGPHIAADMKAISDALDLYKVDCGHYPTTLDALWERPPDARRWGRPGPYLNEYPPKDPWGNDYQYVPPVGDQPFDILSFGADGAPDEELETSDLSWRTLQRDER